MTSANHDKFINYNFTKQSRGKPKKEISSTHQRPSAKVKKNTSQGKIPSTPHSYNLATRQPMKDHGSDPALDYLESIAQSVTVPAQLYLDMCLKMNPHIGEEWPVLEQFDGLSLPDSGYFSPALDLSAFDEGYTSYLDSSSPESSFNSTDFSHANTPDFQRAPATTNYR